MKKDRSLQAVIGIIAVTSLIVGVSVFLLFSFMGRQPEPPPPPRTFVVDFRRLDDRWALANYYVLTYVIDKRPYEIISRNRGRLEQLVRIIDPNWRCNFVY